MDILEVIALIGLCLTCIKLGYMLGKKRKKITARPAKLAVIFNLKFQGQPPIGGTFSMFILLHYVKSCKGKLLV